MTRTLRYRHGPLALLVAISTLVSACSGDGPTSPSSASPDVPSPTTPATPPSLTGTYRLAAVNGCTVPCVFDSFSPGLGVTMSMEAVRGQIILNADGTYLQDMELRLHNSIDDTVVLSRGGAGVYVMTDGTLTMTPFQSQPFAPHYVPGQIEIQSEAPGLDGAPEVFIFTFRR
jgi:hypothetical protein